MWCLMAKKSALFAVGKAFDVTIDCLCIGHDSISWTRSLKYLGMFFYCWTEVRI